MKIVDEKTENESIGDSLYELIDIDKSRNSIFKFVHMFCQISYSM